MRTGILFGPAAGEGKAVFAEASLARAFKGSEVALCPGRFGGSGGRSEWKYLSAQGAKRPRAQAEAALRAAAARSAAPRGYVGELREAVESLLLWGAELLVCVGGDGLASYAADAMLSSPRRVPLLGVAAGTINAGPIVKTSVEDLERFDFRALRFEKASAVEVSAKIGHIAYGFNDIVIGESFLGTLEGRTLNLSADLMLKEGVKRETIPGGDIAGADFYVKKNGAGLDFRIRRPAQIILSPLGRREFFARAAAGVLCNAAFMASAAALCLFDFVLIKAGNPERGLSDFAALEQLLFAPGDSVELGGLKPGARIIADGNPFDQGAGPLRFRLAQDIVDVACCGHRHSEGEDRDE